MEFRDVLAQRRMHRSFRADPVAEESIERIVRTIRRAPSGGTGLYDVLDLILDKGIVIDAFVRVSLVGIELLTVDARVVIASVDTYLRYAEGAERLCAWRQYRSDAAPARRGRPQASSRRDG